MYYFNSVLPTPMAYIAINKSRLKTYNKNQNPTYYLEDGTEFQIELFNPTQNTVLAKIQINSKSISQGGLILRPGERVFLDRYFDVSRKFKFDVYEVSNTNEVKKAIENNGEIKIEFFNETLKQYNQPSWINIDYNQYNYPINRTTRLTHTGDCQGFGIGRSASYNISNDIIGTSSALAYYSSTSLNPTDSAPTLSCSCNSSLESKSIETGRVETGGYSDQKFESVDKDFNYYPFCTINCKLLPLSQKVNSVDDVNVKRYCCNCGGKLKPTFKVCPFCGKTI